MRILQPLEVQHVLEERGLHIVTASEFSRIFHTSLTRTQYFLETYTNQGLFVRLKKGLYAVRSSYPSEEEIANALYQPSYLSFEYALARYNIIPEMVYVVTSATTKPTRRFEIEEKPFEYLTIKKKAYTGYVPVKEADKRMILLAEPEKALVDYLYFVSLGKKSSNDRLNVTRLDKEKVITYAALYSRDSLNQLIETLW